MPVFKKHVLFVDGDAVGGHFSVHEKRNSTSRLGGFSADRLARQFQERFETTIKEASNTTGLGLVNTATPAATPHDDVDVKGKPRLRYMLDITLTSELRKSDGLAIIGL